MMENTLQAILERLLKPYVSKLVIVLKNIHKAFYNAQSAQD